MELNLTELNAAKDTLAAGMATAGVMQADIQKYWIPYTQLFTLFTEVIDKLGDIVDKINDIEEKIEELENP